MSTVATEVISPVTKTCPFPATVSQATLANLSFSKYASNILSDIVSHNLSGCPSVTLSDVNNLIIFLFLLSFFTKKPLLFIAKVNNKQFFYVLIISQSYSFVGISTLFLNRLLWSHKADSLVHSR